MCLHFLTFACLLHLLLSLPSCSNKKLVRERWILMFIFSSLCKDYGHQTRHGFLFVVAISCRSRASNLYSYNIRLVNFLFALVCQLGLCLSTRHCVFRSLTLNWKPRHHIIIITQQQCSCITVHGNVYWLPKKWLIWVIKWPSLVQILWSFEVETFLLNPVSSNYFYDVDDRSVTVLNTTDTI